MKLCYTTHKNGRAEIVDVDAGGAVVGKSKRSTVPIFGYIYTITANDGKRVYEGNTMSSGLARLEAYLKAGAA
jgi:hypothetical protein